MEVSGRRHTPDALPPPPPPPQPLLSYKSVFECYDVSAVPDEECYQVGLRFQNVTSLIAQADWCSNFRTPIEYLMHGF